MCSGESELDFGVHCKRIVKLHLIGNFATGKSTYFNQIRSIFPPFEPYPYLEPPPDVVFLPELQVHGHKWQVRLSDTNGQERYYSTPSSYLRDATAVMILYRTDDIQSFEDVRKFWLQKLSQHRSHLLERGLIILLIGNRWEGGQAGTAGTEVPPGDAEALCKDINSDCRSLHHSASHWLVNAASGEGVRESMEGCLDKIRELISQSDEVVKSLSLAGTVDLSVRSYGPGDLYRHRDRDCCH